VNPVVDAPKAERKQQLSRALSQKPIPIGAICIRFHEGGQAAGSHDPVGLDQRRVMVRNQIKEAVSRGRIEAALGQRPEVWAIHPGGKAIVDQLVETFDLAPEDTAAQAAGAELMLGVRVQRFDQVGDGYAVEARSNGRAIEIRCRALIAACGRSSSSELPPRLRAAPEAGLIGIKRHYQNVSMPPQAELYFFKGGYIGLAPIEGGRVNVCLLASRTALQGADGDPAGLIESLAKRIPSIGNRLAGGELTLERWEQAYRSLWHDSFDRPLALARRLETWLGSGVGSELLLVVGSILPPIARKLAGMTRSRETSAPPFMNRARAHRAHLVEP